MSRELSFSHNGDVRPGPPGHCPGLASYDRLVRAGAGGPSRRAGARVVAVGVRQGRLADGGKMHAACDGVVR